LIESTSITRGSTAAQFETIQLQSIYFAAAAQQPNCSQSLKTTSSGSAAAQFEPIHLQLIDLKHQER
jgi:hypothetical protein